MIDFDKITELLVEMFGDKLPCPVQEPARYEYYLKLFKYEYQIKGEAPWLGVTEKLNETLDQTNDQDFGMDSPQE